MEDVVSERDQVRGAAAATPITRPEEHPDWPRVRRWASLCAIGKCRYPSPDREDRSSDGCPGTAGFAHLEDGVLVMRYRYCDRRLQWERVELDRRRRRTDAKRAAPGSGWREGA